MKFHILTIFPEMFESFLSCSIIGRAMESGCISVDLINIRDYSLNKHRNTDDYPYGGGAGMLMMAQPIASAIKAVKASIGENGESTPVIYMSPKGAVFRQEIARSISALDHVILLCGHYEGIDQRIIDKYVDMELSIGDYVLTGGEVAAMVVIDSVSRLIPGTLGSFESVLDESFSDNNLEYPQYTRPRIFEGMAVPEVLLNGNHAEILKWRTQQSRSITQQRRPDLLGGALGAKGDEKA